MENAPERKSGYGKRPLWQWIGIYAVIAVVVYGLAYYLFFSKNSNYAPNQTNQNPSAQQGVGGAGNQTVMMTVTGNEFAFQPTAITVKTGKPIQLTFKNSGQYPHNLSISELNVRTKTIQPGEEDTVTFTPDKAGTYTYICTVPGHADRGMQGTLIVQ